MTEFAMNDRYVHQMGIYGSDEEFLTLILPFALGGIEVGEPVVFAYDPYKTELLQQWLPDDPSITYVTDMSPYATPAKALLGWRKIAEEHLAAGAPCIRLAGNVPHPGYGYSYAGWDRYEAAIDRAWGDLPVWAPCLYDARCTPPDVLAAAARLHHQFLEPDGTHRLNAAFQPSTSLIDFVTPPSDPLEQTPPAIEMVNPAPARARLAISGLTRGLLRPVQSDDLVLAISEAVTNALLHGEGTVTLRAWVAPNRVVVHIHDEGNGPLDALAGLWPTSGGDAESGRGLWIAHQLGIDVALVASNPGFTVRLRVATDEYLNTL